MHTPAGFRDAYAAFARDGWVGLTPPRSTAARHCHTSPARLVELMCAANLSFATYAGLTAGAYRAVLAAW